MSPKPNATPEQDPLESENTQDRRASIDSILDAVDRVRSATSFESGDNSSSNGEYPDNDINSDDGGPGEGQASGYTKRTRVRGKNYAKNRR